MSHEKNNNKPQVSFDRIGYKKGTFKDELRPGQIKQLTRDRHHHRKGHHHNYKESYEYSEEQTRRVDSFLTHPVWGLIAFIFIIWFIFFSTFSLGAYPQAGIEWLMDMGAIYIRDNMTVSWFADFLSQGVIMGVGSVLAFLPNILILFFFLALLQETQYISRAATIMDRYMHKIGLHGSSFIPLLMGFGCNVPAIMATRTIKRKSDRILTMLMIPYIPCSARIPTFLLFSGIFFPEQSSNGSKLTLFWRYIDRYIDGYSI